MSVRSPRVAVRATLNFPLIHERVAALGLVDVQLRATIGTTLYDLTHDPDARAINLTMLVRLSRLLEVPLDDLVTTDDPHVRPAEADGQVGDDYLLLGLLATYSGLHVVRILSLLGWTRPRLDAALTIIDQHLAPTALRVVATDERLTVMLRTDVIPALIRTRFEREYRAGQPLDPKTAVAVLHLVREKILEPFPEPPEQRQANQPKSFDAVYLVSNRLAVPAAPRSGGRDTADVEIHPDVLFALGLIDTPVTSLGGRGAPDAEVP